MDMLGERAPMASYRCRAMRFFGKERKSNDQMIASLFEDLSSHFQLIGTKVVSRQQATAVAMLEDMVASSPNMTRITAPFPHSYFPQSIPHPELLEPVKRVLEDSDNYFREEYYSQYIPHRKYHVSESNGEKVLFPTLASLCYRAIPDAGAFMPAYDALKTYDGRRQSVSAMADLSPEKIVSAYKKLSVPPDNPLIAEIMPSYEVALNRLYYAMGTADLKGTIVANIDLESLEGVYMGSSNGKKPGPREEHQVSEGVRLSKDPCGKKYENFYPTVKQFMDFVLTGDRPTTVSSTALKDEMKHDRDKPKDPDKYAAWLQKVRIFIMPDGFIPFVERVAATAVRRKIEVGNVIRIGQTWSHGGMDFLARALQIDDEMDDYVLEEGDFNSLDTTVRQKLIELFYAASIYYFKPDVGDYDIILACIQLLIEDISQRITLLYGDIWVIITGNVPSGIWNTSMADSWIVALLFFWYVSHQMKMMPAKVRRLCEKYLVVRKIHIVDYGDDHGVRTPKNELVRQWISLPGWNSWLGKYWGMQIRDMKQVPFLSVPSPLGYLITVGLCFLKYYAVRNPEYGRPGQPKYLPYRPTAEITLRLIWSREPRRRDLYDIMLSCLGHAYGTYASNLHAYLFLRTVYAHILQALDLKEEVAVSNMMTFKSEKLMKDIKKRGMTEEQFRYGFPTLEKLFALNVVEPAREFLGATY